MTEQDILQLRDLAEAGQVQFKERIVSKDDKYEIGCEMVAFSNSRGGRLIIGINDKSGEINALSYKELQETTNLLTNIASENVIPNVLIEVENIPVTGGAVVIATIPEGKNKPYHDNKGVIWIEIHSPGALPSGLTVEDIKNGTSMPRNMFLFTNANYLLPYTGAGSGVRRALEYDPNVIFSNGLDQREITHSANEFVITIPRKSEQVTNQVAQNTTNLAHKTDPVLLANDPVSDELHSKTDPALSKTDPVSDQTHSKIDPALSKTDPVDDQPQYNEPKLKLSKKQQDIRNYCSIPRSRQEILQRADVSDHFYNRKKYIYDLVEAGVLERTIPDNPNDPNQKYRRKQ